MNQPHNKLFKRTLNSWLASFLAILANNFSPLNRALGLLMKVWCFTLLFWGVLSLFAHANDILTANKELYEKANSGDVKSIDILSRFYINQYSWRYNPEHSKYWRCRKERIVPNDKSTLDCAPLLKDGEQKNYATFFERGEKIRDVKLSSDAMHNLSLEVPPETEWNIRWNSSSCDGICSYEISIDGYYYIGVQKKYLIGRESTLSLSSNDEGEIWVQSGSIVTLQLDPQLVSVSEHAN